LVTSISTMLLACVCHYESTRTVISLLLSWVNLIRNDLRLHGSTVEHVDLLSRGLVLGNQCSLGLLVYRDALLHHSL
jgi:hypothetical protein